MIPRAPDGHRNAGETIAANIAKLPELASQVALRQLTPGEHSA